MNAFDSACGVETQANAILLPYLHEISDGRMVLTNKGTLAKWLQESAGDLLTMHEDRMFAIELKAERKHTGNLFLEVWSNRNLESRASHAERGQTPGWMMKTRADLLLYYFLDVDVLYSLDVLSLKRWMFGYRDDIGAWGSGKLNLRKQGKYNQLNDTWGVLAPVSQLRAELPVKALRQTNVRQRALAEVAA